MSAGRWWVASAALLSALLWIAGGLLLRAEANPPVVRHALTPDVIGQSDRQCFAALVPTADLAWPHRLGPLDGMEAPTASPHGVLENGRRLGPPHAQQVDIASRGVGAFCYWGDAVFFSSSDGSDPRSNGRTYEMELVGEMRPAPRLAARALLVAACATTTLLLLLWLERSLAAVQRRHGRRSPAGALSGMGLAALGLGALVWAGTRAPVIVPIAPQAMVQGEGHAFTVFLPPLLADAAARMPPGFQPGPSNRMETPAVSRHRLRLDDALLPQPDTQMAFIAAMGAGRHVVWGDALAFSSPDGSDPRDHRHRYELAVEVRPAPWLTGLALLTTLAGVGLATVALPARTWRRVVPIAASAIPAMALGVVLLRPADAWVAGLAPVVLVVLGIGLGLMALAARLPARWLRLLGRTGADPADRRRAASGLLGAARRVERLGSTTVQRLAGWRGLPPMVLMVALSLLHAWAPVERPTWEMASIRGFALFDGRAQASDAFGYLAGSVWARELGSAGEFASRRPVYSAWLVGIQTATGLDLQTIAAVQALLAALALWLAMGAVIRHVGPAVGMAAGGICLGYIQQFVGMTMNETLGLPLGLLSVALLLPGLRRRSIACVALGAAALALGLIVRPGAMFVLPLVPLAVAWVFLAPPERATRPIIDGGPAPGRAWRRAAGAAACCILGMVGAAALNGAVARCIGDPSAATNSNFSYVIYGLSIGKEWGAGVQWLKEHAPEAAEREQAARLVQEAMANIRRDPSPFLGALGEATRDFLTIGLAQISTFYADRGLLPIGQRWWSSTPLVVWGLLGPLAVFVRGRGHPRVVPLLVAVIAGVLLSVPFIWRDGHWRALATTVPLQALVAVFFLAPPRAPALAATEGRRPQLAGAALGAVALVALLSAVATLMHARSRRETTVQALREATVYSDPGALASAEISPTPTFRWFGPAALDMAGVRQALRDWGVEESIECLLEQVQPTGTHALVQVIGIGDGAGTTAALLLVPPNLVDLLHRSSGDPAALEIDWCGETLYLGRLGVLRGVRRLEGGGPLGRVDHAGYVGRAGLIELMGLMGLMGGPGILVGVPHVQTQPPPTPSATGAAGGRSDGSMTSDAVATARPRA